MIKKISSCKALRPNEKYILLALIQSDKERFTITEVAQLTGLAYSNVYHYINHLAKLDFLDLIDFGNIKEIILKEK